MQQIIYFFIRNKNSLLFSVLFAVSILLTLQTHNYHNHKFVSSANAITGGIFTLKTNLTDYFSLSVSNKKLHEENLMLRQQLEKYRDLSPVLDTTAMPKFEYVAATVINNNYSKTKNQITLFKGKSDGLERDMGVISTRGIIGIVSNVSENYATVQSILNTNSKINAQLKKSNHFGTLIWNTKDPNVVQLIDIPRVAHIEKGDTIITGGKSTIFPEGIPIGTVLDFNSDRDENYHYVNVKLFNDMTNLKFVYLIKNNHAEEIQTLEKETGDAE